MRRICRRRCGVKCEELLIDVVGLAVTARNEDYVKIALAGCDDDGPCTAIGHARTLSAAAAALVNGTAIHGEDFDDTFEGGPVHAGAVIVPAVLAACERHNLDGPRRAPRHRRRRRDHVPAQPRRADADPQSRLSSDRGVRRHGRRGRRRRGAETRRRGRWSMRSAPSRSMAGGIIEYLAEGAWTKRLHAGWAAQSGMRAALLGRAGFSGPRTVFEGVHGFFHGFAHTTEGDYDALIGDFGARWVTETLAFKPYPCGTMTHPYIDCARRLGARIKADDVVEMVCEVGEGTVHRLWEPLAAKQHPANGYAGKFSTPYCIAAGFVRGNVGLSDFSDAAVHDPAVLALAAKVRYRIDPKNPYPKNFTGHIRLTLRDGSVVEERQPYMRGGAQEPLTRADIEDKFRLNAKHGGWSDARAAEALEAHRRLVRRPGQSRAAAGVK